MLNYAIAPELLAPFVPAGTELDFWQGKALVSVVGFRFLRTRVWNISVPFHRNFEEVNLRFYVRRATPAGWRRGVVFIKEIVPRAAIAWAARTFYNENYLALPMSHQVETGPDGSQVVSYAWQFSGRENFLRLETRGPPQPLMPDTEPEFIAEHYWGYARQRDGTTLEYQVEHPPWRAQTAVNATLDCDAAGLYGPAFAEALRAPDSAFLADGSPVTVRKGVRLT